MLILSHRDQIISFSVSLNTGTSHKIFSSTEPKSQGELL